MLGKQLKHVIKKRQPGTDAGLTPTIEVKLHPHIGLFGFTLDLRDPRRGLCKSAFRVFHRFHLMEPAERRCRKSVRQTSGTSEQVPRSGTDLQPRVAAAATLGDEFQFASTPMGLRPLPCAYTQRSRRAATLGWRSLPLRGMKPASLSANSPTDRLDQTFLPGSLSLWFNFQLRLPNFTDKLKSVGHPKRC